MNNYLLLKNIKRKTRKFQKIIKQNQCWLFCKHHYNKKIALVLLCASITRLILLCHRTLREDPSTWLIFSLHPVEKIVTESWPKGIHCPSGRLFCSFVTRRPFFVLVKIYSIFSKSFLCSSERNKLPSEEISSRQDK